MTLRTGVLGKWVGAVLLALVLPVARPAVAGEITPAEMARRANPQPWANAGAKLGGPESPEGLFQASVQGELHEGLARSWRRFVELFYHRNYRELLLRLDGLDDLRQELAIRNLLLPARALSHAAHLSMEAGDHKTAGHLARAAVRLAPDLPDPHYRLAAISRAERRSPVKTVRDITHAWSREWRHLPSRMQFIGNRLGLALLTFGFAVFVFGTTLVFKHLPTLAHDLHHLFPRGVLPFQTGLLLLFVLLLPLILGVGVLPLFLVWLVVPWCYQSRTERVVVILMLVATAFYAPLLRIADHAIRHDETPLARHHFCFDSECSEPELERLREACARPVPSEGACLALARVLVRRDGRDAALLAEASRVLDAVTPDATTLGRAGALMRGHILHARAVAHCRAQQLRGAETLDEEFDQLSKDALDAYHHAHHLGAGAEALLGKSLLAFRRGERETGRQWLDDARAADARLVSDYELENVPARAVGPCDESMDANRWLMSIDFPFGQEFIAGLRETSLSTLVLPRFNTLLMGAVSPVALAPLALALVFLAVLLSALGRRLRPSWRCGICGGVGCLRCRRELCALDICEECLYIRIKGSFVDAKDLWFRQRRIQDAAAARARAGRLLSLFLPGTGHLFQGRALAGLLLMALFSLTLTNALFPTVFVPDWVGLADGGATRAARFGWGAACLFVYLITMISSARIRRAGIS